MDERRISETDPLETMVNEILGSEQLKQACPGEISPREVKAQLAGLLSKMPEEPLQLTDEEVIRELLQGGTPTDPAGTVSKPRIVPTGKRVDARVKVEVAEDLLSARIRISPPQGGGRDVCEDDILEKLREARIIKGIKFEYIYRLVTHTVYNRAFRIAAGEAPVDGEDGRLACHFITSQDPGAFQAAEDYRKVEFTSVKKGDLLCDVHPATPGKNGFNILGQTLRAKDGKPLPDPAGSNVYYGEGRAQIFAACEGLACLQDSKVHVRPAQTIDALVNQELEFDGTVLVNGDVRNGSITATGDIIVRGTVQGARLQAKGNIVLCKGVTGKNSTVEALGNVRCYFIEQAEVRAEGDIYADVALRADIQCGGSVYLSGGRGALLGGACHAGRSLVATNIGNDADVPTYVCLAGRLQRKKEREALTAQMGSCQEALDKLALLMQQTVAAHKSEGEKKAALIRITYTQKRLESEMEKIRQALDSLAAADAAEGGPGKVVANGVLYPNVTIEIDGASITTKRENRHCAVVKRENALAITSAGAGGD